jgi:nanoRNase/pAp phosphatase (c-di-AMP/oligoRNAs hydrolase)
MEGFNKFIPYYLFPEAVYCVGLSRSSFRSKISVGSNPWTTKSRKHNLAALCERHGGGGHAVVGAISFPPEDLARARRIAGEIVEELRSED